MISPSQSPTHHRADGGFRNPWLKPGSSSHGGTAFLRWMRERRRNGLPARPPADAFPLGTSAIARPRAGAQEVRITWVGHATFLVQIGNVNLLTDPIWSDRASPFRRVGPKRLAPPGIAFDALPDIDIVLLSHDHFDHLDRVTVSRLAQRFGAELLWISPLGYSDWLHARGAQQIRELDWWQSCEVRVHETAMRVTALPAQHWTRRSPFSDSLRLWASFALSADAAGSIYFAGDSGYFPGFREIGQQLGPFDAALLPIGAYSPRWFMQTAHMNPEESVQAFRDLAARLFVGMHWGTFILSDEPALEPPERTRAAFAQAGFDTERLWIPRRGETRRIRPEGSA